MSYFSVATLAHIWLSGWGGGTAVTDDLTSTGTGSQTILDANADNQTNSSGSGSQSLSDGEAVSLVVTFTSDQTLNESLAEIVDVTFTNVPTVVEALAETTTNSANGSQTVLEYFVDSLTNSGSADTTITEAFSDSVTSSGAATPSITDGSYDSVTSSGTVSLDTIDALAEGLRVVATAGHTVSEALAEFATNSAEGQPSIVSYDSDTLTTSGQSSQEITDVVAVVESTSTESVATQVTSDALAEAVTNNQTAIHTMVEVEAVSDVLTNIGTNTPSIDDIISSPFEPAAPVTVRQGATQSMFLVPVLPMRRYVEELTSMARRTHVIDEVIVPVASVVEDDKSWIDRMLFWLKSLVRRDKKEASRELPGLDTLPYIPHGDVDEPPPPPAPVDVLLPVPLPPPTPRFEAEEVEEVDQFAQARQEDDELLLLGAFRVH